MLTAIKIWSTAETRNPTAIKLSSCWRNGYAAMYNPQRAKPTTRTDEQKTHEPAEQGLPSSPSQEAKTSPEQQCRADANAPLLEHEEQSCFVFDLDAVTQRQPQSVKQPGTGPDGEIAAAGVAIEIIKN